MTDYELPQSEPVGPNVKARAPINISQQEWPTHTLLRRARVNSAGDGLEWPGATNQQLDTLRDISLGSHEGVFFARLDSQVNFDFFVDNETNEESPAQPPFHEPDKLRFYTRVTNGGFHVVGGFSAITLEGRRRYFQWFPRGWTGIGLVEFLGVRDDSETLFSEVTPAEFEYLFPGSSSVIPEFQNEADRQASRHRRDPEDSGEPENYEFANQWSAALAQTPRHTLASDHNFAEFHEVSDVVDPASHPEQGRTAPAVPQGAVQRSIAVALATVALRGCTDRMGSALIDHAARVSESFDVVNENVQHCATWLHDVLECSDLTDEDLRDAGLTSEIVDVVRVLTHDATLTEEEWLSAICSDPNARAVKLAAIADNASPWRLRHLDETTQSEILSTLARWRDGLTTDLTDGG